jgi:Xaa-Pro aminopeptidase
VTETTETTEPTYSWAERERRWNLARTFMDREGVDALLVYGEHEDSGLAAFYFDTWFTNDRPGSILVFPRSGEPIVHLPISTFVNDHMASSRHGDDMWIPPENIRVAYSADGIADALTEHGLTTARIGVIGLEPYPPFLPESIIPHRLWQTVENRFRDVVFEPVGLAFSRLLMPLGDEEIAVVRHAAAIGDKMAEAMVAAAGPGVSEAEVYAAGMAAAFRRGTVMPGMHLRSGPEPAGWGPPQWAYRPQAPRILQDGDVISTEVFCAFGVRATQHQVCIAVGDVHEDFERAAQVARDCYDAGLATLQAGRAFGDVAEAMLKPVEDVGGWVRGPQLHGLNPFGAFCRYPANFSFLDGAERYPKVVGMSTTLADMELEPGMTSPSSPAVYSGAARSPSAASSSSGTTARSN